MTMERKISQSIWENPELQPYIIPHLVPTDEKLGEKDGSYGFAKKVKLNGMLFAAKIIHKYLIQPESVVVKNYIKECQLIATIDHSNIVQFVGLCNLPSESELPLLVMELMDSNLHDYLLDDANANIPSSLKQSILEDVARGLSYLHNFRTPIIHRDLTASNVLLDSALTAKISDFGNSRFLPKDFNPAKLSKMPGTMVYMPPEAITQHYDTKLDIFSFGHLALFTLTQVFPENLLLHVHSVNGEASLVGRSEVERRKDYIEILIGGLNGDENHPLIVLVKECLANKPEERPTADTVCRRLHEQQQRGYSKQLIHVVKELEDTSKRLQETSTELQAMKEQFGSIILPQNGADGEQPREQEPEVLQEPPIHMTSHPQAVVLDDKIYLGGGYATPEQDAATVLMFDSQTKTWSTPFPRCPTKYFGLTHINRKLAIVAGTEYSSHTKTGYVYTWDLESDEPQTKWERLQCTSMLNYRSLVSVVSYGKWLIAVGGEGRDGRLVDAVEKLNTEAELNKFHWTTCAKLSTKSVQLSLCIVDDKLFAFCASDKIPTSSVLMPSNAVFWADLDQLIESNKDTPQAELWHEIKQLPIKSSTALSFKGFLYALGGIEKNSFNKVSNCVYKYNNNADGGESPGAVWKKVCELPFTIYQCATVQLGDEIFLYGKSNEYGICVYTYALN